MDANLLVTRSDDSPLKTALMFTLGGLAAYFGISFVSSQVQAKAAEVQATNVQKEAAKGLISSQHALTIFNALKDFNVDEQRLFWMFGYDGKRNGQIQSKEFFAAVNVQFMKISGNVPIETALQNVTPWFARDLESSDYQKLMRQINLIKANSRANFPKNKAKTKK